VNRFQFVADHQDTFEVKRLCQTIAIARSSYYRWLKGADARARRRRDDENLAERIRRVHKQDRAQGAPRITVELNDGVTPAERVNHKRVARVMRAKNIAGIRLRRRVRTTIPDKSTTPVPDLVNRDFTAEAINQKYVGDITYLPYGTGQFLYLATLIAISPSSPISAGFPSPFISSMS
jgi:transposase InsO family protein